MPIRPLHAGVYAVRANVSRIGPSAAEPARTGSADRLYLYGDGAK